MQQILLVRLLLQLKRTSRYFPKKFGTLGKFHLTDMESLLKKELGCNQVKSFGFGGGGCINSGQSYETDTHGKVFVKMNSKSGARTMFDGEMAGLDAILATNTVKVPHPYKVLDHGTGAILIMEHLDMRGLGRHAAKLGERFAQMHLHNEEIGKKETKESSRIGSEDQSYISKFGFDVPTCCGFIPQDNTWQDDWVTFYTRQKLAQQIGLIEKESGDREALELWSKLQVKIPEFFKDMDVIKPALLHGDLWGGNAAETTDEPVIFDPAPFYGHHEFDLAIAGMFGGFGSSFYSAYHNLIPKEPGFQQRNELYKLFHYLNHWNHFGSGYRSQSLGIMRSLVR